MTLNHAIQRLMVLDAIVEDPDLVWLGTVEEKVAHLTMLMRIEYDLFAVLKVGFTERQARLLTTVMLHSGVCVPRQYARFCGIVHGEKTRTFFAL